MKLSTISELIAINEAALKISDTGWYVIDPTVHDGDNPHYKKAAGPYRTREEAKEYATGKDQVKFGHMVNNGFIEVDEHGTSNEGYVAVSQALVYVKKAIGALAESENEVKEHLEMLGFDISFDNLLQQLNDLEEHLKDASTK
jgi:hypothetical protein